VVVDGLAFQRLYFSLELLFLEVIIVFLGIGPFLNSLCLLLIIGKFLLLEVLIFVHLGVFHFEL
jgi:hypothetical protein